MTTTVICGAQAAACRCALPPGHAGPHECAPDVCTAAWYGDIDGADFTVVRLPYPAFPTRQPEVGPDQGAI